MSMFSFMLTSLCNYNFFKKFAEVLKHMRRVHARLEAMEQKQAEAAAKQAETAVEVREMRRQQQEMMARALGRAQATDWTAGAK